LFEATRQRARWPYALAALALAAAAAAVAWVRPAVIERLGVLAGGGNPLADPFASGRVDQRYAESPLAVSLALEAGLADGRGAVDADGLLAFADDIARDLGFWLLARTGASDIEAAERALWEREHEPDAFAVAWAGELQRRKVYAREAERLSDGVEPEGRYRYAHPDELVLLLLHVAWRLDLGIDLVRSPVHRYATWREPGGPGLRGIEPTCFQRVDMLGKVVPSDEPSVGRRLTFPPEHYPSGAGGIRNPSPLPAGAYEPVSPAGLAGDLLVRLAARYGGGIEALEAKLAAVAGADADPAVVQAVYRIRLADGVAAWERGDASALERLRDDASTLERLRTDRGGLLPDAPDEAALAAAVAFADGRDDDGQVAVREVLAYYEPPGAPPLEHVRSDAHAVAMWLDLEHPRGGARPEQWNARVVPLLNRYRGDPERIARLCTLGRPVLTDVVQKIEELVPECASAP
jgi:hypothetical protein